MMRATAAVILLALSEKTTAPPPHSMHLLAVDG
ncbi:MAG: hypothetical protein JWM88_1791 [Verrucomicrobia bacterium]|nr:hypothetical protein [Verrucomicrobiota bacterium]